MARGYKPYLSALDDKDNVKVTYPPTTIIKKFLNPSGFGPSSKARDKYEHRLSLISYHT